METNAIVLMLVGIWKGLTGTVEEIYPEGGFLVRLDNGTEVDAFENDVKVVASEF